MYWPVPVYTSVVTFLVGVPELWMAQRPRSDGSHGLSKGHLLIICGRLFAFYLGLALWFFEGNGWAGGLLISVSLLLYYASFVAARTVDQTTLTRGQQLCLLFSLGFPSTNFVFDVGGAFNPFEHFVLVLLVVLAAVCAVVVFAVLEPLNKAYGCYPSSVPWYELDKGLCPRYFGASGDESRSPICREETFGDSCQDQLRPPPTWYHHVLWALLGHAVIVFMLGSFSKFKGITGKSFL